MLTTGRVISHWEERSETLVLYRQLHGHLLVRKMRLSGLTKLPAFYFQVL